MNFKKSILFKLGIYCLVLLTLEGIFVAFIYFEFKELHSFVLDKNEELKEISLSESTAYLKELGIGIIKQRSLDIAKEIDIYLEFNPDKKIEDLTKDEKFKSLAVQKFGIEGYTAISDEKGINYFHPNPEIEGTDLRLLDDQLPGFWGIIDRGLNQESSGFYKWKDENGNIREKYMFISPVSRKTADGKILKVASTTYIDEFYEPINELKKEIASTSDQSRIELKEFLDAIRIQVTLLAIANLIAIFLISLIIYKKLILPIRILSRASEEISHGNFDAKSEVISYDEITDLSRKFNQMAVELKKSKENIGNKIKERTSQLERINKYMVNRELKMIELKKEIDRLKKTNK